MEDRVQAVLTTVLLVRVVFAVVVAVARPGATDTLAVVAVEVQRGTRGKHWEQTTRRKGGEERSRAERERESEEETREE